MNRNQNNHHHSILANNNSDGITQSDAISPRFRNDSTNEPVLNYCYSCKSEFTVRIINDLMEHYSRPHERFAGNCLYCKTGKVHQYKSYDKGVTKFYHDCYRSKMKYDK